jgi:hypothetical protein
MGYIGSVYSPTLFGGIVRVTSCSLNPKQAIEHPDVIDGSIDWTVYQLKGIESEGDVAIPVLSDPSAPGSLQQLWTTATLRDSSGELTQNGAVTVTYGQQIGRTFNGCKCNSLEIKATAGERVDATMNLWGTTTTDSNMQSYSVNNVPKAIRILAWADLSITGQTLPATGCIIRDFSCTVANNLSRNYTFCPNAGYYPSNISTGKRHVSGTLGFQGFAPTDQGGTSQSSSGQGGAEYNYTQTSPNAGDLVLSITGTPFSVAFHNIVFEFQSIEAQPAVLTSTVNWYAHALTGGLAISPPGS